jgi:hypothetical protein
VPRLQISTKLHLQITPPSRFSPITEDAAIVPASKICTNPSKIYVLTVQIQAVALQIYALPSRIYVFPKQLSVHQIQISADATQ